MKIAVYPGSFDPITLGHLNVIRRASRTFDKLIVCVMANSGKQYLFSEEERVDFIRRVTLKLPNVDVDSAGELVSEYARRRGACAIVKGLRATSDFEKEFQMALINRKLNPNVETLFLPASEKYTFISSSTVKEMARYGVDLSHWTPREIIEDVMQKFR